MTMCPRCNGRPRPATRRVKSQRGGRFGGSVVNDLELCEPHAREMVDDLSRDADVLWIESQPIAESRP